MYLHGYPAYQSVQAFPIMPELVNDRKVFSLQEVSKSIQKTLDERYTSSFWIKAEMNKLNYYQHSGHCYPELVEKQNEKVIAQIKSTLWKESYRRINKVFLEVLHEPLKDGIKILFQAKITFDPVHGLALNILDIDPGYTLGDLEREKQETIQRLKQSGIYDKNKQLPLPLLPQRIAIISVETSKGYADFLKMIEGNDWNYRFFYMLFPSLLQGEKAVDSILQQLKRIEKVRTHFDVVAIIRGGGGDVGLSCYNHYKLSKAIADFPIPVLTGIGHATNETVAEMVAYYNAITPTKLGDYLLRRFHDFAEPVQYAEAKIADRAVRLLAEERRKFQTEVKYLRSATQQRLSEDKNRLANFSRGLEVESKYLFRDATTQLEHKQKQLVQNATIAIEDLQKDLETCSRKFLQQAQFVLRSKQLELSGIEKNISNMDPKNVLRRGYSYTLQNGKAIQNIQELKPGAVLTTFLPDGKVESTVQKITPEPRKDE
jgi:exodeoxyribonuclease VII large subunit